MFLMRALLANTKVVANVESAHLAHQATTPQDIAPRAFPRRRIRLITRVHITKFARRARVRLIEYFTPASATCLSSRAARRRDSAMAIHVVLVHPEIHWNTGNAGRTCLAAGATLHLIEPLGFSLDEREVKRAGLDYWEHVDLRVWPSWEAFERELPALGEPYFFSTKATQLFWDAPLGASGDVVLVFGRETGGLPGDSRALSRSLRRDADSLAARAIAESVDERGDRGLRGAPAAALTRASTRPSPDQPGGSFGFDGSVSPNTVGGSCVTTAVPTICPSDAMLNTGIAAMYATDSFPAMLGRIERGRPCARIELVDRVACLLDGVHGILFLHRSSCVAHMAVFTLG